MDTIEVTSSANSEDQCVNITARCNGNIFTSKFTIDDAKAHGGMIINEYNYLAIIPSCIKSGKYETEIRSETKILVSIPIEIQSADAKITLSDAIELICIQDEIKDSDKQIIEARRDMARLADRCAQLEAEIANMHAISLFCAEHGRIPRAGYDFYIMLIGEIIRGNAPTFPIVGLDFIRIGDKYYRCMMPGLKQNCITCCFDYRIIEDGMISATTTEPPHSMGGTGSYEFKRFYRKIARVAERLKLAVRKSIATIRYNNLDCNAWYVADLSLDAVDIVGMPYLDKGRLLINYIKFKGDSTSFFGFEIENPGVQFYCNGTIPQAVSHETITAMFGKACNDTRTLQEFADKCGLEEYIERCGGLSFDCIIMPPRRQQQQGRRIPGFFGF